MSLTLQVVPSTVSLQLILRIHIIRKGLLVSLIVHFGVLSIDLKMSMSGGRTLKGRSGYKKRTSSVELVEDRQN